MRMPDWSRTIILFLFVSLIAPTGSADMPAPEFAGQDNARVESILGQMTVEEKIDLLGGVDFFYLRGVPRLGVPRLRMADGPMGVRNDGPATAFGGGIALAASWNPELLERVGVEFGRETRAKGAHFLLAPGVNIYRSPLCARNFEYFGEDPLLASSMAVAYIKGVQSQGVSATVKHFVGNNSEFDRNNTDSIIDERTLREIYLPAFEAAVKQGQVGAIMTGYNLTNGSWMSENDYLNNTVAKGEWGFQGVMMSDWISTYHAVEAANGGLDFEMPSGAHLNRENLLPAIEAGQVSMATIDDKVRRILRTAARFGWLDGEALDLSVPRYNRKGRDAALEAARQGMVLLKNDGALLPLNLDQVGSILVVGPNAHPAVTGGGGSSRVEPFSKVSLLEGLAGLAADEAQVFYAPGVSTLEEMSEATRFTTDETGNTPGMHAQYFASSDLSGAPVIDRVEPRPAIGSPGQPDYPEGTLSERWTGYFTADEAGTYDFFVLAAGDLGGLYRLNLDGQPILDRWNTNGAAADYSTLDLTAGVHKVVLEHRGRPKWPGSRLRLGISRHGARVQAEALTMARAADVVLVAAGFNADSESEGLDRTFRLPPAQTELINELAAVNENTVVVMTAGGAVDANEWLDQVPSLLHVWFPGQEGGKAAAEILLGHVNPSGRLPATFERRLEDNPAHAHYYPEPGTQRIVYSEGVFVGYRGYEKNAVAPLFPFGHGLSYTTFEYANLGITPASTSDGAVEVTFDVTNTGSRPGADVAQVYVADPESSVPRPPKELRGFARVDLMPGETRRVSVSLDRRALSFYDVKAGDWRAEPGEFNILVGRSSANITLRGSLVLTN
ncbi:MAG: glycoside hydrolase [Xanthomonadales bacterium]|nr:glycoside hydrolase family 3 C-terminal domain-containing protein [Gammaproteobacteria bacterium]NND57626.1 glycoside hydrolase [Xanthomonadales bacterium]NNK52718.1 glycoside hydrolase [Xanthomonadales bacterium]